jgi:pimeloyl-ACP methyl ester carboxylesterase
MRTIIDTAHDGASPEILLALLPGTFSEPEDFVRAGFPAALRAEGIDAELVMAEARAAWFADGSIVARLEQAVIGPARARGRSRIWLAGISLGALAALGYAARRPHDLEGIALISPYPATREVLREVDAAGGLDRWRPTIPPQGDLEREAWRWLATRGPRAPAVFCYYASGDRFAEGQRRMAGTLDPNATRELPGGHDWAAWRALWQAFLADHGTVLQ